MDQNGHQAFAEPPIVSILTLAKGLEFKGVPKCREFAEMIAVAAADDPSSVAPTRQALEVARRDASIAEEGAAKVVALVAAFARSSNFDDQDLGTIVLLATHFALRFEECVAERTAGDPF